MRTVGVEPRLPLRQARRAPCTMVYPLLNVLSCCCACCLLTVPCHAYECAPRTTLLLAKQAFLTEVSARKRRLSTLLLPQILKLYQESELLLGRVPSNDTSRKGSRKDRLMLRCVHAIEEVEESIASGQRTLSSCSVISCGKLLTMILASPWGRTAGAVGAPLGARLFF